MSTYTSRPVSFALVAIVALPLAYFLISLTPGGNAAAAEVAYASDGPRGSDCNDPNCPGCQAFFEACGKSCSYDSGCDCGAGIPYDTSGSAGIPYDMDDLSARESGPSFSDAPGTPAPASSSGLAMGQQFGGGSNQFAVADTRISPNMIGDTSGGGCGGLHIRGVQVASISHPTFACSRLNIAENNSPIVRDRAYFTYRHFHNASTLDLFSYSPQGRAGDFNIDRYTFAFEKKIGALASIEFRLPLNTQMPSSLHFTQTDSGTTTDGSNNNLDSILGSSDTEVGNISVLFKRELYRDRCWYFSGGAGVNIPTAPSVQLSGTIDDENFQVYDPLPPHDLLNGPVLPNGTGDPLFLDFNGTVRNETVNLSPFIAGVWTPNRWLFAQGFMQIDIPLNSSAASLAIDYDDTFEQFEETLAADISQQTLMRLNFGVGRWICRNPCRRRILNGVAAMFEVHYTTTLNDAGLVGTTFPTGLQVGTGDINLSVGNLANRVDVVNLVAGVPVVLGKTTIYNGFIAPIRTGADRGFDFEYTVSLDRRF